MEGTINMQDLRYLNLFNKVTNISTRFCFKYNEIIYFCVPKEMIFRAIGEGGRNIKRISETFRKRVRIIEYPKTEKDLKKFVEDIVNPVTFKEIEIKDNEIILTAGSQSKASLIGRNKRRLIEMQGIIKDYFGKGFRIQ
jgi:NusA-like KH domain protein